MSSTVIIQPPAIYKVSVVQPGQFKSVVQSPPQIKVEVKGLFGSSGGTVDSTSFVFNEVPSGAINGANATFTTAFQFIPETVQVSINGLEQKKITHYNTSGNNTIIFTESPQTGDQVEVDYIKL